jgi:hypothetical protein
MTMTFRRGAVFAALIATLLAVGTAFAASPTLVPSFSGHSHAPDSSASAKASEKAEASEASEDSKAPEASEAADASPGAGELARVLDDLKLAGIPATADELQALAAKVGLGGAVRVLAFANASGKSPDDILAMFQSGKGWGEIARELDLTIGPGIGGIMSQGQGQGQGHGKGQGQGQGHGKGQGQGQDQDHGHGQGHGQGH